MRKKSFTIIEILITMLIMGTMSATIIPRIGDAREETEKTVRKINETRDFACELGLDDMCANGGSSSFDNDNSDGVRHNEKAGEIKVCKDGDCITMQDKNVGATSDNINRTDSYGNYFQWGNNYGFTIGCWENGCNNKSFEKAGKPVQWEDDYDYYGYNSQVFMTPDDIDYWENGNHYDQLRGGEIDNSSNNWGLDLNNQTNRQGPCQNGYHIPSLGEWNTVLEYRAQINGINLNNGFNNSDLLQFKENFNIPLAGRIHHRTGNPQGLGMYADFWTSTPNPNNGYAYYFYLNPGEGGASTTNDYRTLGLSIRCFKNRTQEVEQIDNNFKKSEIKMK